MAETLYAKCGDLSLAYQVFGDGPVELVLVGPMVFHVELFWAMPEFKAFFDQLATFCRVVMFDKAGNGLSDPIPKVRLLEERAAEIEAVMDAVGFAKAVVFGMSEGGPQAIVFAARRPERTRALILYGSLGYGPGSWDELDGDPAELRARLVPELGEDYTPSTKQVARAQEMGRAARSGGWGSGAIAKAFFPSVRSVRQLAAVERMCASPGMFRATTESNLRIDVRPILPTLTAPTLIIHAREDIVPVQFGRYLADHIPGARYLEVDGAEHAPWLTEPDKILDRDRGVPHRQPCRTGAVPSRPAHRAIHRYRRLDATRRSGPPKRGQPYQPRGSEFECLRGVDLPRGDLARLLHEGLHLGIAIHCVLDLAELGPVLGGDEHRQSVRLLAADHEHHQGDVLPAVLLDDLHRLLELLLQLVPNLARPRVDRHRVNNGHIPRPFSSRTALCRLITGVASS